MPASCYGTWYKSAAFDPHVLKLADQCFTLEVSPLPASRCSVTLAPCCLCTSCTCLLCVYVLYTLLLLFPAEKGVLKFVSDFSF